MPFRRNTNDTKSDDSSLVMEPIDENCVPIAMEYLNPTDLYGNIGSSESPGFVQVQLKDTGSDAGDTSPIPTGTSIEFQVPTLVAIPLQEVDIQFPFFKNAFQYDSSKLQSLTEIQPQIFKTLFEGNRIMKLEYMKPKTIDAVIYLLFLTVFTLFCLALMVLPFLFMFVFTGGIYVGLICLGAGVVLGLLGIVVSSNSYRNQLLRRKTHAKKCLIFLLQQENALVYEAMGLEWNLSFDVNQTTSAPTFVLKKK